MQECGKKSCGGAVGGGRGSYLDAILFGLCGGKVEGVGDGYGEELFGVDISMYE